LWPLLEGRLEIGRIALEQPMVRLIRAADGRLNYATLGGGGVAPAPVGQAPSAPADPNPPSPGAGLAWAVALFDIDDGSVAFVDHTVAPPRTTAIRKISLR